MSPVVEAAPTPARSSLGVWSVVCAAIATLIYVGMRALSVLAPLLEHDLHLSYVSMSAVLGVTGWIEAVVGVVAVVLGIVGVTRPRVSHSLAAVGLAVGATATGTFLLGVVTTRVVTTVLFR